MSGGSSGPAGICTASELPVGWPLERPPLLLETSIPGVFAAGDVRHRSIKRVISAVGEGVTAIQLVHEYLRTDRTDGGQADRPCHGPPDTRT